MITVNNLAVDKTRFPDGTYLLHQTPCDEAEIKWIYEADEEVFQLYALTRHLRERGAKKLSLNLPFLPNARMDRVKREDEVFTLKYFCELINALRFDKVSVWDVHSNVGAALIDRLSVISPQKALERVIDKIGSQNIVIYFPDEGAHKRYADMLPGLPLCYGRKKRDWESGKIQGLEIEKGGVDLRGKRVLMVDDICSYGGTFYYSAIALIEEGASEIYSFATHTENSLLAEKSKYRQLLETAEVVRHYTTPSLIRDRRAYVEEVDVK